MTEAYVIVSKETNYRQFYIWGIATSRAKAEIACKTVQANNRAHGMLQILDIELDALCPDEGMVWRVAMGESQSEVTRVKIADDQYPIVRLETGFYLAFVNTKYKEDACSEANKRRLQYGAAYLNGTFYDRAVEVSEWIKKKAHEECDNDKT